MVPQVSNVQEWHLEELWLIRNPEIIEDKRWLRNQIQRPRISAMKKNIPMALRNVYKNKDMICGIL